MSAPHRLPVRVRYPEADPMGRCHHGVFAVYFEMGRTELLRERGLAYAEMERRGELLAIARLELRYHAAAYYDEELVVETQVERIRGARIEFANRVVRPEADGTETLIAEGRVTGALVGRDGRVKRFDPSVMDALRTPSHG